MKTSCLIFAVLLLTANTSDARPIRNWTYNDLLKESDLVVIANVTDTKVVPTTDDVSVNGLARLGRDFQQLETVFLVRVIVKGEHKQERLHLVHFGIGPKTESMPNGPMLIEFSKSDRIARTLTGKERVYGRDYLLFLKIRNDGKYDPVTGQVDSVLSVRELGDPMELLFRHPNK